ncbi:hypothetical protein D3C87_1266510 [compost metagenome]
MINTSLLFPAANLFLAMAAEAFTSAFVIEPSAIADESTEVSGVTQLITPAVVAERTCPFDAGTVEGKVKVYEFVPASGDIKTEFVVPFKYKPLTVALLAASN